MKIFFKIGGVIYDEILSKLHETTTSNHRPETRRNILQILWSGTTSSTMCGGFMPRSKKITHFFKKCSIFQYWIIGRRQTHNC